MYHVSAQGVDERMINIHYYYYYTGCECCLQVTDCLGVVFVHSVIQITPKVNILGGGGGGGGGGGIGCVWRPLNVTLPTDESILESLP